MNKKLLISTALASVALSGAALAEMKIGGDMEVTLRSFSKDISNVDGGTALGQETNLTVSGSKEMDNGMTLSFGGKFEADNAAEVNERYMQASNDAMFIGYARDNGKNVDLDGTVAPHVGDQNDTLVQTTAAFKSSYLDIHGSDHLTVGFNVLGGSISAAYTPDEGANGNDSGTFGGQGESNSSGYSIGYKGSLGIEGLSVIAGIAGSDETKTTSTGDREYSKFGVAYNFGQFSVGGDVQDFGNGRSDTTDGSTGAQAKRVNATFAASDNLAVGISWTETEESLGQAASGYETQQKEEITAITVGYNIAGLGFNLSYAEVENLGGSNGVDASSWQIQTKQSF
jgi:hypothetical protein